MPVLMLILLSTTLLAEPVPLTVQGYTLNLEVTLPVPPERAFDLMTGDISGWWDHSFSEKPKRLYIEPKPGGGFYEIFDDAGNGARHAVVTYADRGKQLRFEGPLGLAGRAVVFVTTWEYSPAGNGTLVTCTVNTTGQIDAEMIKLVEQVWHHFLIEQLKPYVEGQAQK